MYKVGTESPTNTTNDRPDDRACPRRLPLAVARPASVGWADVGGRFRQVRQVARSAGLQTVYTTNSLVVVVDHEALGDTGLVMARERPS